jgi:two-component system osmolarity sensor histidine kinase EnvZ
LFVLGDNLAARIVAILLGSFLALMLLVAVVVFWPKGDDLGGLFAMPVPEETAAIVEALEASPRSARPLVLKALNASAASVHIEPDFPPARPGLHRAKEVEWVFARYSRVLGGRPFRVELRGGLLPFFLSQDSDPERPPARLSVGLKDGSILVVERRPTAFARSYVARIAVLGVAAAVILICGLTLAIRQTARPVGRLAVAVQRFSIDGRTPDLPLSGPRELRDLSAAFNDMQYRIRGLVDDRTRVLAAIAHDLRTYLTRLRLRMDFIPDDDQRVRAEKDIEEMSLLIDDTLLFTGQTAKPPLECEVIDAVVELEEFVALRRELGEPIEIERAELMVGGAKVRCDSLAFRRMLANLADNAIRYGGLARISVGRPRDAIEIVFRDNGPGIPQADLVRLMKPFERLESSRARATGGAGLGLAIVKALAESSGGTLTVENCAPNGLKATIELAAV